MPRSWSLAVVVLLQVVCPNSAGAQTEYKLTDPLSESGELLGTAVAISGDYAIVGAPNRADGGKAVIFYFDGLSWSVQAQLFPTQGGVRFGASVGIWGDYAIVGAPLSQGIGRAFVYHRVGTSWSDASRSP